MTKEEAFEEYINSKVGKTFIENTNSSYRTAYLSFIEGWIAAKKESETPKDPSD